MRPLLLPLCLTPLLVSCSTVPPLSQATGTQDSPIFVSDVVRRIKCEIADAFDDKVNDPHFLWLDTWTAKVDLSLQINEFAGVSPSAAYTKFFKNAFNFDAGSQSLTAKTIGFVNQTVSVGASANLGEQAVRTEVVTFSLSVKEIKEQSKHPGENGSVDNSLCSPTDLPGLRGGLGLREWVNSALYPVALKELQFGYHPSPVVSKQMPPPTAPGQPKPSAIAPANLVALQLKETQKEEREKADSVQKEKADRELAAEQIRETQYKLKYIDIEDALSRTEDAYKTAQKVERSVGKIDTHNKPTGSAYKSVEKAYCTLERMRRIANQPLDRPLDAADLEWLKKNAPYHPVLISSMKMQFDANVTKLFEGLAPDLDILTDQEPYSAEQKPAKDGHARERELACDTHDEIAKPFYEPQPSNDKAYLMLSAQHWETKVKDVYDKVRKANKEGKKVYPENGVKEGNGHVDGVKTAELAAKYLKDYDSYATAVAAKANADLSSFKKYKTDPPVDGLLHYVNFVLAYGGGVSPNWSFIAWKGPSSTGPLASAQANRTHTLQIALAPNSGEQNRLIQNQAISALSSSLPIGPSLP